MANSVTEDISVNGKAHCLYPGSEEPVSYLRMNISVIICTKDRPIELTRFVKSLNAQTLLPDQLVIVDASDNDNTRVHINEKDRVIKYAIRYVQTAPGLTRQRNIGIREAKGKYVFFFDDDVVLDSDYIRIIMETFSHLQGVQLGGLTGRIVNIEERPELWETILKMVFFLSDLGDGKIKLSGFPSLRIDEKASYVGFLSGCNMVYPKAIFSEFMFDENLTGYSYMEDVDLSYRVSKKYRLYYQPKAKLKHLSTTYKSVDSRSLRRIMVRNHYYLFRKNLPKDLPHLFAFAMSIVGLLLYNGLIMKDILSCIGIVEGLMKPLKAVERPYE